MDRVKYAWKALKRLPMHRSIRDLLTWESGRPSLEGYSIVIACMRSLPALAAANVRLLSECQLDRMQELVLVFDCDVNEIPDLVVKQVESARSRIPIRMIGYSPHQVQVTHRINWGWVYSWLSWSTGIREAKTRHVILQDLDALALEGALFETLYQRAIDSGATFSGIQTYRGSGVEPSMQLATTFQLAIDTDCVKREFVPFDGFNRLEMIDGKLVDFDTFLWMQWRTGGSVNVEAIDESWLMHPTQLICNYTDFVMDRPIVRTAMHSLVLLPYFFHLGGDDSELARMGGELRTCGDVTLEGKPLPIAHLPPEKWAWLEKQTRRVEQSVYGATRPEVESFLEGIITRAGDARSVGREDPLAGGVAEN